MREEERFVMFDLIHDLKIRRSVPYGSIDMVFVLRPAEENNTFARSCFQSTSCIFLTQVLAT